MSYIAAQTTIEELRNFIIEQSKQLEDYDNCKNEQAWPYVNLLFDGIIPEDDLNVKFDFENYSAPWYNDFGECDFHQMNGFAIALCAAGGDWELPVHFAIYKDTNNQLRAYVPTIGNVFNIYCKCAFGSEGELYNSDINSMPEELRFNFENLEDNSPYTQYQNLVENNFSVAKMLEDIAANIHTADNDVISLPDDAQPIYWNNIRPEDVIIQEPANNSSSNINILNNSEENKEDENVTINNLAERENNITLPSFKVIYNNYSDDLPAFIQATNMQFINDRFGIACIKLHEVENDNFNDDDYTIFVLDKSTNIIYMQSYTQQPLMSPHEKIIDILKQSKIYTKQEYIENPANNDSYHFIVDNNSKLIDILNHNNLTKQMNTNNNRFYIYIYHSSSNKTYLFIIDMKDNSNNILNIYPSYNYLSMNEYNDEIQHENNIFSLVEQLKDEKVIHCITL